MCDPSAPQDISRFTASLLVADTLQAIDVLPALKWCAIPTLLVVAFYSGLYFVIQVWLIEMDLADTPTHNALYLSGSLRLPAPSCTVLKSRTGPPPVENMRGGVIQEQKQNLLHETSLPVTSQVSKNRRESCLSWKLFPSRRTPSYTLPVYICLSWACHCLFIQSGTRGPDRTAYPLRGRKQMYTGMVIIRLHAPQ